MKINPRGSFSNGVVFPTATPVNQNKKRVLENIFLHLSAGFGLKIQNTNGLKSLSNFLTSGKLALNGPPNGPAVRYSKIQNRLRRVP